MAKNYRNFEVGDKVKIVITHNDDLGKIGEIVEVRNSFCKILFEGEKKPVNHTYRQFIKVEK